jgi:hypothetical protein
MRLRLKVVRGAPRVSDGVSFIATLPVSSVRVVEHMKKTELILWFLAISFMAFTLLGLGKAVKEQLNFNNKTQTNQTSRLMIPLIEQSRNLSILAVIVKKMSDSGGKLSQFDKARLTQVVYTLERSARALEVSYGK